jgi:hypothetical protein
VHFLKWDLQPERRTRSWALSIKAQRLSIGHVLADNPGLKPRISEAIARAYSLVVVEAAKETGLEEGRFPANCPYGFDEIASRTF